MRHTGALPRTHYPAVPNHEIDPILRGALACRSLPGRGRPGGSRRRAAAQAPFPVRASSVTRIPRTSPGLSAGKYVVVIDLDSNLLHFTRDRRVLWSAPVGTGTGLRLEGPDGEWDFSTPDGIFHVQYKEESPVWMAPDWYFVENKLPVPPPNDPKRRFPGGLAPPRCTSARGWRSTARTSRTCWPAGVARLHPPAQPRRGAAVPQRAGGTEVVIVGGGRPDGAAEAEPAPARAWCGTGARRRRRRTSSWST